MSAGEIAGLMTAAALLLGSVVAHRKFGPESNAITVTNAGKVNEMTLSFASKVDQDNDDLRAAIANMRREIDQYREDTQKHISELNTAYRGKVAEVKHLEGEVKRRDDAIAERDDRIDELTKRVKRLETEVATLTGKSGPHAPS